jgi:hypothetical protein
VRCQQVQGSGSVPCIIKRASARPVWFLLSRFSSIFNGCGQLLTAKRARRRILVVRKLIYGFKLKIRDLIVSWQSDLWHEASMLQLFIGYYGTRIWDTSSTCLGQAFICHLNWTSSASTNFPVPSLSPSALDKGTQYMPMGEVEGPESFIFCIV